MTPARTILTATLLGLASLPFAVSAKVGLQPGYENIHRSAPEAEVVETEMQTETGTLIKFRQRLEKMNARKARTRDFWENMMNFRKAEDSYRKQHAIRREKRRDKRLNCRIDVRKANRDAILRETLQCFKATVSQDLEILRKERLYIEKLPGVRDEYRGGALFHSQNLSDALQAIIQAIDAGVYTSKEGLQDAKRSLSGTYRAQKRLAMTRLRINRSLTWISHLLIRLDEVSVRTDPDPVVAAKIEEVAACLEGQEKHLEALLSLEDNDALIAEFRQAQSDIKFCIGLARDAKGLSKELEQGDAESE